MKLSYPSHPPWRVTVSFFSQPRKREHAGVQHTIGKPPGLPLHYVMINENPRGSCW